MSVFENDGRLESSFAQAKAAGTDPCGCRWALLKRDGARVKQVKPGEGGTHAQLVSVCVLHRRWLAALFRDSKRGPDTTRGQLPRVGALYQPAQLQGEITRIETAAAPMQQGGIHQMVGPLHQPVVAAEAEPGVVEHVIGHSVAVPEGLKELLGFDPNSHEGGQ